MEEIHKHIFEIMKSKGYKDITTSLNVDFENKPLSIDGIGELKEKIIRFTYNFKTRSLESAFIRHSKGGLEEEFKGFEAGLL